MQGPAEPPEKIKDDKQLKRKFRREREREKGERIWMRICVWMGARYRTERSYWYFSVVIYNSIGADSADLP